MAILLAVALLGLPGQAAAPPAPPQEDIVVVGERMRRLKLVTRVDRKTGARRCVFRRRSGDAAFDTLICDAVLACGRTTTVAREMETCLTPHLDGYVRMLAARREARTAR